MLKSSNQIQQSNKTKEMLVKMSIVKLSSERAKAISLLESKNYNQEKNLKP